MKTLLVLAVIAAIAWLGIQQLMSPKAPDLTISEDEVLLAAGDLDYRFSRGKSFDGTYMLFGGTLVDHHNAIANVYLAGLNVRDARPIYRRYPDFHRCASPGASLAKDKVVDFQVVPADDDALADLRSSIEEFDDSIGSGGDRVCVRIHGSRLKLTSAEVREVNESVIDSIQMRDFHLIDSLSRVDCREALKS